MPVLQVESPEFQCQSHQKKKKSAKTPLQDKNCPNVSFTNKWNKKQETSKFKIPEKDQGLSGQNQ